MIKCNARVTSFLQHVKNYFERHYKERIAFNTALKRCRPSRPVMARTLQNLKLVPTAVNKDRLLNLLEGNNSVNLSRPRYSKKVLLYQF